MKTRVADWCVAFLSLFVFNTVPSKAADPPHGSWSQRASMISSHEYHAAVALHGRIYVLGGDDTAKFEEYDPATDRWKVLPQMPTPGRCFLGAAAVGGKVYAIGGTSRQVNAYATVEAYDVAKDSWSTCASLPAGRSRLAAVAVAGKIYALGGMDAHVYSKVVEAYDPASDRWTRRADLPIGCHGHSAVVLEGRIFVVGGEAGGSLGELAAVQEYNPVTDRWTRKAPMPTRRAFLGAAVVDGYLYAIAGRVHGPTPVERYNPKTDQWTRLDPMPAKDLNRIGIATLANKIYLLGGEFQGDRQTPKRVWCYEPVTK